MHESDVTMDTVGHVHRGGRCQFLVTESAKTSSNRVVVVGMNGSDNSWDALTWACTEAIRLCGSVITVVINPAKDTESGLDQSLPLEDSRTLAEDPIDWLVNLRHDVKRFASDLGVRLTFVYVQGDPVHELVRIAELHEANLIAVGRSTSATNGIAGSLGRRLIANREMPVIIDID